VAHPEPTKIFLKPSPETAKGLESQAKGLKRSLQEVTSQDEIFMLDTSSYIQERVNLLHSLCLSHYHHKYLLSLLQELPVPHVKPVYKSKSTDWMGRVGPKLSTD